MFYLRFYLLFSLLLYLILFQYLIHLLFHILFHILFHVLFWFFFDLKIFKFVIYYFIIFVIKSYQLLFLIKHFVFISSIDSFYLFFFHYLLTIHPLIFRAIVCLRSQNEKSATLICQHLMISLFPMQSADKHTLYISEV